MSTNDRACEIMQELQNNNNEHMEELQNLCHAQLRSIIKTSNFKFFAAWSKEDFMNEAVSLVWKKCRAYDLNKGNFSTWFRTIVKNLYIDRYNQMKDSLEIKPLCSFNQDGEEVNILDTLDEVKSCETEVISKETCQVIWEQFRVLTKEQRRAIELCRIEGYKPAEAAAIMGCKPADVSRWINRGLKKMEECLREEEIYMDLSA